MGRGGGVYDWAGQTYVGMNGMGRNRTCMRERCKCLTCSSEKRYRGELYFIVARVEKKRVVQEEGEVEYMERAKESM